MSPPKSDSEREFLCRWVEDLQRLATKTRNPLYVWKAMSICFVHELHVPDWCMDYVCYVATGIHLLMEHAEGDEPRLTPEGAIKRIPNTLGLSRAGWNAFTALASDEQKVRDAAIYQASTFAEQPDEEVALERIRRENNLETRRSARSRVSQGLALLGNNDLPKPTS